MKRIIYIICAIFFAEACTYEEFSPLDWSIEPYLELEESGLVLPNINQEVVLDVLTNINNITVYSTEDWCKTYIEDKRVHLLLDKNINIDQRDAIVSVIVSRGKRSVQRDVFVVQTGGYWDMVGDFPLFWSSAITESQKQIISQMIHNMVFVRGGKFVMGKDEESHNVTLSDYYISKYELTQAEWNAVMATNKSYYKGSNLPVTNLSYEDVQVYLKQLNYICGLDFRLPTEAQWEFAARGGLKSMGYLYSGGDDYSKVGHFVPIYTNEDDVRVTTYPVGQFIPNELGLYDMSGNVAELCYDLYDDYSLEDQVDPLGPSGSGLKFHVSRGESFDGIFQTVYDRSIWTENSNVNGFRVVLML